MRPKRSGRFVLGEITIKKGVEGNLVRDLDEEAAGTPRPYRMEDPPTLASNLTQNGNRGVLHFLNWTGNTENEANHLCPAENVTVRMPLPDRLRVRSVSMFPDETDRPDPRSRNAAQSFLRWSFPGRGLELVLPQADASRGVSVDLEQGPPTPCGRPQFPGS
jgi:hypothetical protein